ncbi:MAG TPA: helix-turn-helix domain-containing protein, partial [Acidimicrobiales bacterium]|nr:helix-turn-helix domain-containing protein [Acidimicrobiales bacterium]
MTRAENAGGGTADDRLAEPDAWLSEADAARLLGMSVSFVHRQVADGALKGQYREQVWLVARADLEEYIEASRILPRSGRLRPPPPTRVVA